MNSCSNCMHRGASTSSIACRGCDLNTNPIFIGSLDKWTPELPINRTSRAPRIRRVTQVPAIKDVIFNPPATIIIWEDKTKTVVKCGEKDIYDPEKGMAMAISRKALGDRGSYYNVFEKWLEPYYKKQLDKFVEDACLGNLSKIGCVTVDFGSDNAKIVNAETGEVSESDICEYDHKEKYIDKRCGTCKYEDRTLVEEPCDLCTIPMCGAYDDHWKPKESDD